MSGSSRRQQNWPLLSGDEAVDHGCALNSVPGAIVPISKKKKICICAKRAVLAYLTEGFICRRYGAATACAGRQSGARYLSAQIQTTDAEMLLEIAQMVNMASAALPLVLSRDGWRSFRLILLHLIKC